MRLNFTELKRKLGVMVNPSPGMRRAMFIGLIAAVIAIVIMLCSGCEKKGTLTFTPLDGTGSCLLNASYFEATRKAQYPLLRTDMLIAQIDGEKDAHAILVYEDEGGFVNSWEWRGGFDISYQLTHANGAWPSAAEAAKLWIRKAGGKIVVEMLRSAHWRGEGKIE